jgi:hypothetical protein
MVESGKMSQEHFINIISELSSPKPIKTEGSYGKKKKKKMAEANPYKAAMRKQMGLAK